MTDTKYINNQLSHRLPVLISALFPDKKADKKGNEYRIGSKGSLVISDKGYYSFEEGNGGDFIGLIQYALNCDFKEAVNWSENFIGVYKPAPYKPFKKEGQSKNDEAERKKKIEKAHNIWKQSKPAKNTLASEYLQQRGITSPPPASILFNPSVYHFELKKYLPALVSAVQNKNREIIAIQSIFINPDTKNKIDETFIDDNGKEQKAKQKLFCGAVKGGAIRLSKLQEEVIVAEGPEDGLTLLQIYPSKCVWVGCGGNTRFVEFPPEVKKIIIAKDNDTAGDKFTNTLAERLIKEGREVAKIFPPQNFKDFNEMLTTKIMEVTYDQ